MSWSQKNQQKVVYASSRLVRHHPHPSCLQHHLAMSPARCRRMIITMIWLSSPDRNMKCSCDRRFLRSRSFFRELGKARQTLFYSPRYPPASCGMFGESSKENNILADRYPSCLQTTSPPTKGDHSSCGGRRGHRERDGGCGKGS